MRAPGAPRTVVIGTGRSGTGYIAHLLLASGVSNVAHEGWFNPILWGAGIDRIQRPGLDVDVSWLALPFIEIGAWSGPVLHVTRHPIDCIRSLEWTQHITHPDSPFSVFARKNAPWVNDISDPLEIAAAFYVEWNLRCAAVADATIRVEDVPASAELITQTLGVPVNPKAGRQVPTNVHARERSTSSEDAIWELLAGRAAQFGYLQP